MYCRSLNLRCAKQYQEEVKVDLFSVKINCPVANVKNNEGKREDPSRDVISNNCSIFLSNVSVSLLRRVVKKRVRWHGIRVIQWMTWSKRRLLMKDNSFPTPGLASIEGCIGVNCGWSRRTSTGCSSSNNITLVCGSCCSSSCGCR